LVQSAIGYDEKRGDTVEVVSMPFAVADEGAAPASGGLLGLGLEKSDILGLAQSAILAVVVLLALLFVLRPMAMRLSAVTSGGLLGGDPLLVGADGVTLSLPDANMGGVAGMIGGGGGGTALLTDESMVSVQNIEGQLRASAMRKLTELVEQHPEASLSIMRSWMTADEN
jgi:flagellar M-ring protein FliF